MQKTKTRKEIKRINHPSELENLPLKTVINARLRPDIRIVERIMLVEKYENGMKHFVKKDEHMREMGGEHDREPFITSFFFTSNDIYVNLDKEICRKTTTVYSQDTKPVNKWYLPIRKTLEEEGEW